MDRVRIVGILNVTPDSYFDGGTYVSVEQAVARAAAMVREGADVIEVGGESTGPQSQDVSIEQELGRIIPVIRGIRHSLPEVVISVDTYKASVAKAALEEGVTIVNDVTAGRADAAMFGVVARAKASIVLMYAKDASARTTVKAMQYDDVVATVRNFLDERKRIAMEEGIGAEKIILDPGLGHFISSDARYSFEILAHLDAFASLGYPVLVSPSRKSFLAGERNLPPSDRLPATLAATTIAVMHGARFIRTHDIANTREAIDTAEKIIHCAD